MSSGETKDDDSSLSTVRQRRKSPSSSSADETRDTGSLKRDTNGSTQKLELSERGGVSLRTKERFIVPQTRSVMKTLFSPSLWTIPLMLTIFLCVLNVYCGVLGFLGSSFAFWYLLFSTIFWRLMYDVGIGYILRIQSDGFRFEAWIEELARNSSWKSRFEGWFSTTLGKKVDWKDYPVSFNAWLCYRYVADLILVTDFVTYCCFGLAVLDFPTDPVDITQYLLFNLPVGVGTWIFSAWAKSDAHRVLTDFAWYWGDYFFTVESQLTFDGIFQMFPHVMYTVGYTFVYGSPLVARSHIMLFVGVFAHACQMIFLMLVEEPHMEKIYGVAAINSQERDASVLENKSGYFSETKESVFFFNLNLTSSSDIFLLIFTGYNIFLLFASSVWVAIVNILFWHIFHNVGIGFLLYYQGQDNLWTKRFQSEGKSPQDAFITFKKIYNTSYSMCIVSGIVCALKFIPLCGEFLLTTSFCSRLVICVVLCSIHAWAAVSSFRTLGLYGWFFGDFFIEDVPNALFYEGVFRYLNHPDAIYGFLGYYGFAVLSGSWTVYALIFICHCMRLLFVRFVESPFMKTKYGENMVRVDGGFLSSMRTKLEQAPRALRVHSLIERSVRHGVRVVDEVRQKISKAAEPVTEKVKDIVFTPNSPNRSRKLTSSSSTPSLDSEKMSN